MIRFIHCADLHFGRTFQTTADMNDRFVQQAVRSTYQSFETIVQEAISREVDFILISGDVYDHKQRSVRGQWFLKKQAEKLDKFNISIYIIHGNHDPIMNDRIEIDMPSNTHIFSTEVSHKIHMTYQGEKVIIYGFSYPQSAYSENPIPLYNKVMAEEHAYHIGLLHGQEKGQEGHDPYAPFTVQSLKEKEFDYWALGHVHQRQVLKKQPAIVYPGNIQGCHRKEVGAKGAYYVELTHSNSRLQFVETSSIRWDHLRLSISGLKTIDELIEKFNEAVEKIDRKTMMMLTIEGNGLLHEKLTYKKTSDEITTLIYEELTDENIWIDRIKIETQPELQREMWKEQDHLLGDVVRLREEMIERRENELAQDVLAPLFSHRKIRSYLEGLTEDEEEEMIEKAERMILTSLLDEGEEL